MDSVHVERIGSSGDQLLKNVRYALSVSNHGRLYGEYMEFAKSKLLHRPFLKIT